MIQLEGPFGPVYVRRADIVALEGLYRSPMSPDGGQVRDLHVRGAVRVIQILDTPRNLEPVLDALQGVVDGF